MRVMPMIVAMVLMAGMASAGETIPYPNATEPTGQGWDKSLHFAAGALIGEASRVYVGGLGEITGLWPKHGWFSDTVAPVLAAAIVGTFKEYQDSKEPGNRFDAKDLAATVAGAVPGSGIRLTWKY